MGYEHEFVEAQGGYRHEVLDRVIWKLWVDDRIHCHGAVVANNQGVAICWRLCNAVYADAAARAWLVFYQYRLL